MPYPIPGEESSFSADDQYQSQSGKILTVTLTFTTMPYM
jgi:hypothetical protein